MVAQRSLIGMKICKKCGKPFTNKNAKYFCSRECYNEFHSQEHYNKYLQTKQKHMTKTDESILLNMYQTD